MRREGRGWNGRIGQGMGKYGKEDERTDGGEIMKEGKNRRRKRRNGAKREKGRTGGSKEGGKEGTGKEGIVSRVSLTVYHL